MRLKKCCGKQPKTWEFEGWRQVECYGSCGLRLRCKQTEEEMEKLWNAAVDAKDSGKVVSEEFHSQELKPLIPVYKHDALMAYNADGFVDPAYEAPYVCEWPGKRYTIEVQYPTMPPWGRCVKPEDTRTKAWIRWAGFYANEEDARMAALAVIPSHVAENARGCNLPYYASEAEKWALPIGEVCITHNNITGIYYAMLREAAGRFCTLGQGKDEKKVRDYAQEWLIMHAVGGPTPPLDPAVEEPKEHWVNVYTPLDNRDAEEIGSPFILRAHDGLYEVHIKHRKGSMLARTFADEGNAVTYALETWRK